MPTGTSSPRGNGRKRSILMGQKVKVTRRQRQIWKHRSWPLGSSWPLRSSKFSSFYCLPSVEYPPFLRLTSRKPLWLDLPPVDIKSGWRHNWKSTQVVNSHLVCDPHNPATRFWPPSATVVSTEPFSQGTRTLRCCRRKWRLADTDLCPCGEI